MSGDESAATVLIVEDEVELAALYREWLSDHYEVRVANEGKEALDLIDRDVDVALLDRRMPGMSGDEVLEAIRNRGYDCRTAMVTAVDPDFDVVDIPFDDYLSKPVSGETLIETIEALLALDEYSELHVDLSSKQVRRSVLVGEKREPELEESEEFARLEEEIDELESKLEEIEDEHPEYGPVFERIR